MTTVAKKRRPNPNTFESVRMFGQLLHAPGDPVWDTELTPRTAHVPYIVHVSCSVHNTLFMPRIAQEILKLLNLEFIALGGPENCCGAIHEDLEQDDFQHEVATKTLLTFKRAQPKTVLSVCARCIARFNAHQVQGAPIHYAHIADLIVEHLDALKERMQPVVRRVVMHHHASDPTRPQEDLGKLLTILEAIPGVEVVPAKHAGFREMSCPTIRSLAEGASPDMFAEAKALGADTVVMPYQACYRRNVKMQLAYKDIETHHWLSLLAMSLGIPFYEPWKELRLLDDVDAALKALQPKMDALGYPAEAVRPFIQRVIYNV
jgi:hypothetical protein